MKLQNTIFIFCLLLPIFLQAQNQHKIDSLHTVLDSNPEDRQRVDALTALTDLFHIHNNDKGIQYGQKALALAEKIDYLEGRAEAHFHLGWCYLNKDNYPEVHKHLSIAVKLFKQTKNNEGLYKSYRCIGYAYFGEGNYPETVAAYYEAKKIAEILGDTLLINDMSWEINSYLEIKEEPSLKNHIEIIENRLSDLQSAKETNNDYKIVTSLYLLGRAYKNQNNFSEASNYISQALELASKKNFKLLELDALNLKGEVLFRTGNNIEAQSSFRKSITIARELSNISEMSDAYLNLSIIDSALGKHKSSLKHFKLHINYRDSVYNKENTKKILREELKYENEKIIAVEKLENEKRNTRWIAISIFVLLLLFYLFNNFKNKLQKRKLKAQVNKQTKEIIEQKERLQELDAFKSRLYTNITHEFRTPLTVISGIAGQLEGNSENKILIQRNSDQLLNLINQMLDLQKIESGEITIQKTQGDIIKFLRYLTESLKSYAELKGLTLHFLSEKDSFMMDFDKEKITRIHSNLLSNAIKFTPKGGDIYLQLDVEDKGMNRCLILKIKDTGIGIPKAQLPKIFDRFYQVDDSSTRIGEGTGIGLTLVSELVKAMDGNIKVSSTQGKGTTFSITLPITTIAELSKDSYEKTANTSMVDIAALPIAKISQTKNSGKPVILVVEDNPDVIHYLINCLKENYTIEIAMNGEEGIEKAIANIPDIIVSDVMMPIKDGFELCKTLKTDERTSHIPIILLTAKADIESRLEGLQKGADAYLSKPFLQEELLIILKNQLALRKKLQARFSQLTPSITSAEITTTIAENNIEIELEIEDAFLQKIRDIIEKDLSNSEIGITQLVREIGMSRSQIFKKVKALTGNSPSIYMRSIRLYHAQKLLKTTDFNVSEVAYKVGFTSPAYFSNVYFEEFGTRPNETLK